MNVCVSIRTTIRTETNGKGWHEAKKLNVNKQQVYDEIDKLLRSSTSNDDGDEVAQFQADRFIADQFCMVWPKKKRPKEPIRSLTEAVLLQEQMGFQSCFLPQKMDNGQSRKNSGSLEDAENRMLDILQSTPAIESRSQPVDSTEIKTKELDSLLKESFTAYHLGHYSLAAAKYKLAWEMINDRTIKSHADHIQGDVVCYMLCLALLETDQLNNLSEAVELLVALKKRSSRTFPAVYFALSKAHHKHYRFALALKTVEEGFAVLESDVVLTKYVIPGSDVTLQESTREGLTVSLATMKDECSKWHPPDAVCCMVECLSTSRWYGPNRDIYFSDPAFNGMVVLTCNNARHPCTMRFHQACWKSKKDQLSALKKLSDKDVIGYECFTPNCEFDAGNHSLITKVEVYGDDGVLKTRTESTLNPVVWGKRRPLPKGAIPKQQVQAKPRRHSEKTRRPITNTVPRPGCKESFEQNSTERAWRLAKLIKLRKNNFGVKSGCEWRPDITMYGNPQMMEIADFLGAPIFENESREMVAVKTFIFTYFYEFIKETGCVRKKDLSQKWNEDKFIFNDHSIALQTETDICDFLLQSYKLVSMGDYIGIAENMPELYTVVRGEVCDCLRFLLANTFQPQIEVLPQSDSLYNICKTTTDEYAEQEVKLSTIDVGDDANGNAWTHQDKIEQFDMPFVGLDTSNSPLSIADDLKAIKNIESFGQQWLPNNVSETSTLVDLKYSNNATNATSPSVALSHTYDDSLEPHSLPKVEEIHEQNCDDNLSSNFSEALQRFSVADEETGKTGDTGGTGDNRTTSSYSQHQDIMGAESHVHLLKQEYTTHKMVLENRVAELMENIDRLEARCAELELEKLEVAQQLKDSQSDVTQRDDENVSLKLAINELQKKCDKVCKKNEEMEHNFDLLLKEKIEMENSFKMIQREKDKMDKELQKCLTRLEDKRCAEAELVSCLQQKQSEWEQRILELTQSNERKLKLQSLEHEFSLNIYALEKALEKCYDNICMLTDVSKLVTLVTGQAFAVAEAQFEWQETHYCLRRTIEQYKAEYAQLKVLLESKIPAADWNAVKLPLLNIVLPQPTNLTGLYYKERAKSIHHQMSPLPNPWSLQGLHQYNSRPWVKDARGSPTIPAYQNHHFPKNSFHTKDTNDACQTTDVKANLGVKVDKSWTGAANEISAPTSAENGDQRVTGADHRATTFDVNAFEDESQTLSPRRSSSLKKIGPDVLIQELRKKFIGVPELDLLESVQDVRKLHQNTLSGMRVEDILVQAEPFVRQRQNKHMAFYSQSKQVLTPRRMPPQSNKPSQRKLPCSTPLGKTLTRVIETNNPLSTYVTGQTLRIRTPAQDQTRNLANHSSKLPAATPAAMKKQAWGSVTSGLVEWSKNEEDSECPICFESMNVCDKRNPAYTLPCQHSFHMMCIKKWLGETSVCPICRIHCTMDDEFPPLPS